MPPGKSGRYGKFINRDVLAKLCYQSNVILCYEQRVHDVHAAVAVGVGMSGSKMSRVQANIILGD